MDFLTDLLGSLSPAHLFEDPRPVQSPVYIGIAVVLALLSVVGVVPYFRPQLLSRGNGFHAGLMREYGGWLLWLAITGLVTVLLRYASVPFFSKRLWLAADLASLLALGGYFAWYRVTRYQADRAAYEEAQHQRRFRLAATPKPRRARAARRRR